MEYFGFDKTIGQGEVFSFDNNLEFITTNPVDPVDPIPTDYVLAYDFNGDVLDKSVNNLNGIKTGSASFATGRKTGTQALGFVAGLVKTPIVVPLNSDKASVSLWVKNNDPKFSVLFEFSENINTNNGFGFFVRNTSSVYAMDSVPTNRHAVNVETLNPLDWTHYIVVIDRASAVDNEQKIYKNNVLVSTAHPTLLADLTGNFDNHVLNIGSNADLTAPFSGLLQDFRVYNRVLNETERTQLFNE